jgi:hypothetical protein
MSNNKIWGGIPLKDESGRAVGAMAVCFSNMPASSYGDNGLGDYQYAFGLSNDNRTYTVKPLKENPALVAEFVKALPFNSGVDLSLLDAFVRAKAEKQSTYRHALLASDVGSIVRVDCKRSKKVGTYSAGEGASIPAYGSTCEVIVIDNTMPAVIAKKTFANVDMADVQLVDADKSGKVNAKEYVLPKPIGEIKDFIKALPTN